MTLHSTETAIGLFELKDWGEKLTKRKDGADGPDAKYQADLIKAVFALKVHGTPATQ